MLNPNSCLILSSKKISRVPHFRHTPFLRLFSALKVASVFFAGNYSLQKQVWSTVAEPSPASSLYGCSMQLRTRTGRDWLTSVASARAKPPPRTMMTLQAILLWTVSQSSRDGTGPGWLVSGQSKAFLRCSRERHYWRPLASVRNANVDAVSMDTTCSKQALLQEFAQKAVGLCASSNADKENNVMEKTYWEIAEGPLSRIKKDASLLVKTHQPLFGFSVWFFCDMETGNSDRNPKIDLICFERLRDPRCLKEKRILCPVLGFSLYIRSVPFCRSSWGRKSQFQPHTSDKLMRKQRERRETDKRREKDRQTDKQRETDRQAETRE